MRSIGVALVLWTGITACGEREVARGPVWVPLAIGGSERVALGNLTADGFELNPGANRVIRGIDLSQGGALTLTWLANAPGSVLSLRVHPDGGTEHVFEFSAELPKVPQDVRVNLPVFDGAATLVFGAEDGSGLVVVDPVLGPVEIGTPGARTYPTRPDVFFLMADTFRKDNVGFQLERAADGEVHALTPAIDAFAKSAARFHGARAAATWTLPSHAAIFAGRYPAELGVVDNETRLPASVTTLAEHMRAAGYRTVAITDAGFVSAAFGLDQGFAHFEETGRIKRARFNRTLAAVKRVLARDDGRPLFLFVQSYRAHSWVVDEETRKRLGGSTTFRPNEVFQSPDWSGRMLELLKTAAHGEQMQGAEYEAVVRSMIPNYRGASADADAGFGRVLSQLDRRGGIEDHITVFTSDHGEDLGSHGVVSHGNGVWDGQALVPLLVRAPGIEAVDVDRSVTLIDLPRTICGLVNLAPDERWRGADLFAATAPERTLFVFQTLPARTRYVAALEGGWKFIFRDEEGPQELVFAYDLNADPGELENRSAEHRGSARVEVLRKQLQGLYDRGSVADPVDLEPSQRDHLESLGYAPGSDGR